MTPQTIDVLSAMLESPNEDWYGFDICERAGLKSGTVYPMLARLERAGWLQSNWEEIDPRLEGRPARRLYHLTGDGARQAASALDELQQKLSRANSAIHRPRTIGAPKWLN